MTLDFNKIFVIQSLDGSKDKPTGRILFDEIIQHFNSKYDEINSHFFDVKTVEDFEKVLIEIAVQCRNGVRPIIHFELHGSIHGFSLIEGALDWGKVYEFLVMVNIASQFNLFITTGVCFSNFAMSLLLPTMPAAFKGLLGSFETMYDDDIYLQYTAFYNELFNSLDLEKAIKEFHISNPGISDGYKLLDAEEIFKNIYQKYLDDTGSLSIFRQRFDEELKKRRIKLSSAKHNEMFLDFVRLAQNTQKENFIKHRDRFFMYNLIPENRSLYCSGWEPIYFKYF